MYINDIGAGGSNAIVKIYKADTQTLHIEQSISQVAGIEYHCSIVIESDIIFGINK